MLNKKADIASIIFIVVFLFFIGIVLFFVSHMSDELFGELNSTLISSGRNTTNTENVLSQARITNRSVWDWAFFGIFMGSLLAVGLSAYAIRISPVFYWIYAILALVVLAIGTMLSNVWQDMTADPTFATTITQFPITNSILGTYYPMITVAIVFFAMVILFGKPFGQKEGFY